MKEFEAYTLTIMGSRRIYLNFNTLDELKEAVSEHLTRYRFLQKYHADVRCLRKGTGEMAAIF